MYESLTKIPGVDFPPAESPFRMPKIDVPQHILEWREGDEITSEHRDFTADYISQSFNLSPAKAADAREKHATFPESAIASSLALIIATQTGMSADTFKRTFPTIARDSNSIAVRMFLERGEKQSEEE